MINPSLPGVLERLKRQLGIVPVVAEQSAARRVIREEASPCVTINGKSITFNVRKQPAMATNYRDPRFLFYLYTSTTTSTSTVTSFTATTRISYTDCTPSPSLVSAC